MPPPDGADVPELPDDSPLSLQAPVTTAANAMRRSGFSQLGTNVGDRRDFIVLTLCIAQTVRGFGASKAWLSSIGINAKTHPVSCYVTIVTI